MPGIKASPGIADLDVCRGAYGKGSEGVQTAMQRARWKYDQAPLQRSGTLSLNRFSDPVSPLEPDSEDAPSSPSVHAGFENVVSPPSPQISPLSPDLTESGLPPTPPNLSNGNDVMEKRDAAVSPPPLFADGVRNAFHAEMGATPVQQQASPPTPDPSPPRRRAESSTPLAAMQKDQPPLLRPINGNMYSEQAPEQSPGSHADPFQTSPEPHTQESATVMSHVHLPEADRLPQHWLDTTRDLQSADIGLGDFVVEETPKVQQHEPERTTPAQRLSSVENTPQYASRAVKPTLSKGRGMKEVNGLGLSGLQPRSSLHRNAQEYNNQVYRRIQEENVIRHSAVSATSGAITVGIVVPSPDSTPRTLKRQTKCYSLRGDVSNDSKRNSGTSINSEQIQLKNKKVRRPDRKETLDDSPVFESSIRQVSSPAKLGVDASDMTALTFASMQESPTMGRAPKFPIQPSHKLRHLSHEDRLSKNMSVRRTSLELSPPQEQSKFPPTTTQVDRKLPVAPTGAGKVTNNMAVKRSNAKSVRSVTQPPQTPTHKRPDVHLTTEEMSPSGRLRHFSHEARLENNEHVRRTSLDRASQSPQLTTSTVRRGSVDKSLVPASPRRSLDARFLFPTTTPMSVSQFSDRTDNIEIGEANGIRLYQHNNDSLLVVQHGSRPTSKGKDSPPGTRDLQNGSAGLTKPVFAAKIEPPTPTLPTNRPAHQVDSPLTNPRTAPEPPTFKFIPPTPEKELLMEPYASVPLETSVPPQKRLSLVQRARRYSDILLPGLATLRRPSERRGEGPRDIHLSPLWRPQGFWDDFDSDDEEFDDFEPAGTLPRGGDTSNVGEGMPQRKVLFPRAMSKRLPGFRGAGGFLVGNSLGIDRHGTNNRRHYVSTGSRTLSKRQSDELIRNLASNGEQAPSESLRRVATARTFVIPFTGGSRAYWVGTKRFRAKLRAMRLAREERAKERRRERIRQSIGYRVYHDQAGRSGN